MNSFQHSSKAGRTATSVGHSALSKLTLGEYSSVMQHFTYLFDVVVNFYLKWYIALSNDNVSC